jgi:hypothetical protein
LQLIAALSARWGARYTPTGKCIWAELPPPDGSDEEPADAMERMFLGAGDLGTDWDALL